MVWSQAAQMDDVHKPEDAVDPLRAFDTLIGAQLKPAFRLAVVMLGDRVEAEDAVQEAAYSAWRKLAQFRGGHAQFKPWFMAIVANQCRAIRRGRWWSVARVGEIETVLASPENFVISRSDLVSSIRRLKTDERLALFLYFYLDLSVEQSAKALGVSVNGAKSRIHRALQRLRAKLPVDEVVT